MSDESRAYPSPLFFEDRLRIEVEKAQSTVKSLDEALAQLRVIWAVRHRDAVLSFIENQRPRHTFRLPEEVQPQVAEALADLVDATNGLPPGQRHSADQAIRRLIKMLDSKRQMEIIWPWMQETRKFRVATVMSTIMTLEDTNPYADYLVRQFRDGFPNLLNVLAKTPEAAQQIAPEELEMYFDLYVKSFKPADVDDTNSTRRTFGFGFDKSSKYFAMLAAKVLIVGGNTIPVGWLRSIPEVFSWAIDQLADPDHESMLVFLIVENNESPELLWSAIRTAQRLNMPLALERGLDAARALLNMPEPDIDAKLATLVQQRLPDS